MFYPSALANQLKIFVLEAKNPQPNRTKREHGFRSPLNTTAGVGRWPLRARAEKKGVREQGSKFAALLIRVTTGLHGGARLGTRLEIERA